MKNPTKSRNIKPFDVQYDVVDDFKREVKYLFSDGVGQEA
jgi:hypothetical protein